MAIRMCHSRKCTAEIKNSYGQCVEPTVTYEGAVLATYERNGYHDSDFYAIVWDAESQSVKDVMYASTRGWTYHNGAAVDATEDVQRAAEEWLATIYMRQLMIAAQDERERATYGRRVRSLTTRGKNVGVEGVVKWRGENRSRYGTGGWRVGVKVEGEAKLRYLDEDRVQVMDPPADVDLVELGRQAREAARGRQWRRAW